MADFSHKLMKTLFFTAIGIICGILVVSSSGFAKGIPIMGRSVNLLAIMAAMIAGILSIRYLRVRRTLLVLLIVFIFFWIDKNFYFQQDHTGGAFGLSVGLLDFVLITYFFYLLISAFQTNSPFFTIKNRFTLPWLLYLGVSLLTLINSISPNLTILEILRLGKGVLIFYFALNIIQNQTDLRIVSLTLTIMLAFQCFIGFLQFALQKTLGFHLLGEDAIIFREQLMEGSEITRISGTFGNPHSFASIIGFILPVLLGLALVESSKKLRLLYLGTFIAGFLALIITFSRIVIFTTIISLAILIYLGNKRRLIRLKSKRTILGLIFISLIIAAPLLPGFIKRIAFADPGSAGVRQDFNLVSLQMLKNNPLFGIGLNTYTEYLLEHGDPQGLNDRMPKGEAVEHNLFMLTIAETGIIGFLSFIWLIVLILRTALSVCSAQPAIVMFAIAGFSGFVNFLMRSLISFEYRLDQVFIFFWLMAGFIAATAKLSKQELKS
jgi:O-antigen ligase